MYVVNNKRYDLSIYAYICNLLLLAKTVNYISQIIILTQKKLSGPSHFNPNNAFSYPGGSDEAEGNHLIILLPQRTQSSLRILFF